MAKNIWLKDPEEHDFPAAIDYLELLFDPKDAKIFVDNLKKATTIVKKSKDILRASKLHLLPQDDIELKTDFKKYKNGQKLSPILLIRANNELIIADGYHRLCCSYYISENTEVPCRLV